MTVERYARGTYPTVRDVAMRLMASGTDPGLIAAYLAEECRRNPRLANTLAEDLHDALAPGVEAVRRMAAGIAEVSRYVSRSFDQGWYARGGYIPYP